MKREGAVPESSSEGFKLRVRPRLILDTSFSSIGSSPLSSSRCPSPKSPLHRGTRLDMGLFDSLVGEDFLPRAEKRLTEEETSRVESRMVKIFKSLEVKAKDIISNYFNRKLVAEKLDQIMELPAKPIGEEPLKVHRRMNILTASMMRADRVRYQYRRDWYTVYQGISPADTYEMFPGAEKADTVIYSKEVSDNTLAFEARFESGNLWSATKVGKNEYDLRVRPDWNTASYTQWYFFAIGNTRRGQKYKFNFVNMLKDDSLYNYGMQPLAYSVARAKNEGVGWYRTGENICYYRLRNTRFYTFTFTFVAPEDMDTMFFAYCYPFTYTRQQRELKKLSESPNGKRYMAKKILCKTLQGRDVDIVQISDSPNDESANRGKMIVMLSARCHPGETNSSWMFKGALEFLLSDDPIAVKLRKRFVFLCVPMLNPDGVFLGNYRCSFAGVDLNRNWRTPSKSRVPVVRYLKHLILMLSKGKRVLLCTDLHGHSKKMNVFMYGCRNEHGIGSRKQATKEMLFPFLLNKRNDDFSFARCRFAVKKSKNSTYRVALWREAQIEACYTMEASFAGARDGKHGGLHFNQEMLMKLGSDWCRTLLDYVEHLEAQGEASTIDSFIGAAVCEDQTEDEDSLDESTVVKEAPKPTNVIDADPEKRKAAIQQRIEEQEELKRQRELERRRRVQARKAAKEEKAKKTTKVDPVNFQTEKRAKASGKMKAQRSRTPDVRVSPKHGLQGSHPSYRPSHQRRGSSLASSPTGTGTGAGIGSKGPGQHRLSRQPRDFGGPKRAQTPGARPKTSGAGFGVGAADARGGGDNDFYRTSNFYRTSSGGIGTCAEPLQHVEIYNRTTRTAMNSCNLTERSAENFIRQSATKNSTISFPALSKRKESGGLSAGNSGGRLPRMNSAANRHKRMMSLRKKSLSRSGERSRSSSPKASSRTPRSARAGKSAANHGASAESSKPREAKPRRRPENKNISSAGAERNQPAEVLLRRQQQAESKQLWQREKLMHSQHFHRHYNTTGSKYAPLNTYRPRPNTLHRLNNSQTDLLKEAEVEQEGSGSKVSETSRGGSASVLDVKDVLRPKTVSGLDETDLDREMRSVTLSPIRRTTLGGLGNSNAPARSTSRTASFLDQLKSALSQDSEEPNRPARSTSRTTSFLNQLKSELSQDTEEPNR